MDKILILLLGLLAVCVAFLVFAYNQKSKLAEKKVKERFTSNLNCSGCDDEPKGTCDVGCEEQENYQGYRENFDADNGVGCDEDDDCASNYCNNAATRVCADKPKANGADCDGDDDCKSNYCNNATPRVCANRPPATTEPYQGYREHYTNAADGADCDEDDDCASDYCNNETPRVCAAKKVNGEGCGGDGHCVSDYCNNANPRVCRPSSERPPEHYQGYREHYTTCQTNNECGTGGSCVNGSCEEEHFTSNNCDGCPAAPDCGNRGCPTSENFCGTGSCFQEGFRSGAFNGSYRKPAGQEFFQGYGIESFVNGGNYAHFDEHFEEEGEGEAEHYENYNNNVREDFESQPITLKLFYADWCGHCKRFKPTFENELPQVIRSRQLPCKLVAINADEQPHLVKRYNVKGFPTMILEKNGRLIEYNGDRTVSDIERFISKNL